MDILNILSSLQKNNINLAEIVNTFSTLFTTPKNDTQNQQHPNPENYYQLPTYDFRQNPTQNNTKNDTMQMHNTMHSTAHSTINNTQTPPAPALDINKIVELAQTILPLLSSLKKEKSDTQNVASSASTEQKSAPQNSEILKMTKI